MSAQQIEARMIQLTTRVSSMPHGAARQWARQLLEHVEAGFDPSVECLALRELRNLAHLLQGRGDLNTEELAIIEVLAGVDEIGASLRAA